MSIKTEDTNAIEMITPSIVVVRSQRVLLDAGLAALYGVATKALNQAVKRNLLAFPRTSCFASTSTEMTALDRSQSVTGSQRHRDPRYAPFAFTEHGTLMAATVLEQPSSSRNERVHRARFRATEEAS